jgi:hypothetical protein
MKISMAVCAQLTQSHLSEKCLEQHIGPILYPIHIFTFHFFFEIIEEN